MLHDGQADSVRAEDDQRQRAAPGGRSRRPGSGPRGHGAWPRTGGRTRPGATRAAGGGAAVGLLQEPVGQDQPGAGPLRAWGSTRRSPGRTGPGRRCRSRSPGAGCSPLGPAPARGRASRRSAGRNSGRPAPGGRRRRAGRRTAPWRRGATGTGGSSGRRRCRRGRRPSRPGPGGRSGPWAAAATRRPSGRRPRGPGRPAVRRWPGPPRRSRLDRQPLRGVPGGLVQPLGVLQDLGGLVDVLVGDEVVEQRLPPVVAGVEDLAGQLLDDPLDRRRDRPAR